MEKSTYKSEYEPEEWVVLDHEAHMGLASVDIQTGLKDEDADEEKWEEARRAA